MTTKQFIIVLIVNGLILSVFGYFYIKPIVQKELVVQKEIVSECKNVAAAEQTVVARAKVACKGMWSGTAVLSDKSDAQGRVLGFTCNQ